MKTLKCYNVITDDIYSQLKPTGSTPGILYGLPKVHKDNIPMRPILSAIKTHTYTMSKFLIPLISPWSKNIYTINDTFKFVNEINNTLNNNFYMASFDITSLYTNVPINESIDIIMNKVFTNNNTFYKFNKNQFKKFLELSLLDTYFIFNNNLYKQTNGLAMGQPVAPTLANIFLCHHEKKWLDDCPPKFKPVMYKKYMDDTFLLFKEKEHIDEFLNYLNGKHENIKFTKEIETENNLNFLDISIKKDHNKFTTSVYRKPTYTGLTMNFNSFSPLNYKLNLIKTLIYRGFKISSSFTNFHLEMKTISDILKNNGFKISLILKEIKLFLKNKYTEKKIMFSTPKKIIYFKIPYYGNESFIMRKNLIKLINNYYPQIKLAVVFTTNFKMKSLFKFKDIIPTSLRSSVIYKYNCSRCNSVYVGKTSRHLSTRIAEHLGVSFRTGKKLSSPPFSQISKHYEEEHINEGPNKANFSIITSATTDFELNIKESITIKTLKPNLNDMEAINLKIL